MSENEIIARSNCPICGAENQDVKVNKNANLYMFCDNRCQIRFSRPESRRLTDELRAGHVAKINNMILRPINFKKQQTQEVCYESGRIEQRGNITIGRPSGQPATLAGNAANVGSYKPSGIAGWLFGDDDD